MSDQYQSATFTRRLDGTVHRTTTWTAPEPLYEALLQYKDAHSVSATEVLRLLVAALVEGRITWQQIQPKE